MIFIMSSNKFIDTNDITNLKFKDLTEYYLNYYASGDGHTARAKRLDLDCFIKFLANYKGYAKADKLITADWDANSVKQFIETRLEYGEAPATVARRLATLKHMGRTLAERVAGFINPAREVKPPKLARTKPKHLAPEEIKFVKNKAEKRYSEKKSFNRYRNQMLFELMLDTGIRAEEVRLLRKGQLDESLEWLKNVRTKGKRYRNVYITSAIREKLAEYLSEREKKLKELYEKLTSAEDKTLPIFISTYNAVPGNPDSFLMGAKSIWRAINEFSTETDLHPHLLRHSYAVDLLESSNDIRLVAQALGHSDVRITMRYTERHEEQLAKALEQSRKTLK
jgi:site-specific recombinase XerD